MPSNAMYKRRREAGLCVWCGGTPEPGIVRCADCAARHNATNKRVKMKRWKNGRCYGCGRPREIEGLAVNSYMCASCYCEAAERKAR